ncbi:MAG: peptidoglycan D,D-transpeptidase FtsI family protein [Anaeroplasmataceae bacterium]
MLEYMMKKRIYIFLILSFVLFSILLIRMGYISFNMSSRINKMAYDLWSREIPTNSGRGRIFDRNGNLIVGNELCLEVASINTQIEDVDYVSEKLSKILNCSYESIYKHITKKNSVELIKPEGRKINTTQAKEIIDLNMSGIYLVSDTKRYYPYNTTLAQVLGFVGVDNEGLSGIEYMYNDYLKSTSGSLNIYTDAKGNIMPDMESYYRESTKGYDIYLTIDINIQNMLDNVINNAVLTYNPLQMMGIVMNVKTGEVLAMTSYPTFDPGNYQDYDSEIYNRNLPIWFSFEPGSTFKICTYSAGLEEGVFDINDSFYCSGYKIVADRRIKDWKAGGHHLQTRVFVKKCSNEAVF